MTKIAYTYRRETANLLSVIERGERANLVLTSITASLKFLLQDEFFVTLLRAEGLSAVPSLISAVAAPKSSISAGESGASAHIRKQSVRGLSPKAITLLGHRIKKSRVLSQLRKMKNARQIEAVRLMNEARNHSTHYADILLAATKSSHLTKPNQRTIIPGISLAARVKIEAEMSALQGRFFAIEEVYGLNNLRLQMTRCFVVRLIQNENVTRHLMRHRPEYLVRLREFLNQTLHSK